MHVTACLAGQEVDVEVGEDCRTLQALRESVVAALPQLCVEGFDVSVGGRALDDEGVVSLTESASLDVVPNTRGLSVLALHEADREVSEAGLLQAAEEGNVALCTLYLDAGVPLDCRADSDSCTTLRGDTPLHISCRHGHLEIARLLLDRGSTAIDEKGGEDYTPLHHSSCNGYLEIATLLLDRGSTAIDERDCMGYTPLHGSCARGQLLIATLLLDQGSAIDEKSDAKSASMTALHLSCFTGSLEIATLLLDRGSTAIDEKNRVGSTPLYVSCCCGHLEIARLLLDRGSAVIDEKAGDGSTPLLASCVHGQLEIATLLLDRGSTAINEKDRFGDTPLFASCRGQHLPLVTLLLDRGCSDIEKCKSRGRYPQDIMELLLERGHDELPIESAK